jgi:hypothetical protein
LGSKALKKNCVRLTPPGGGQLTKGKNPICLKFNVGTVDLLWVTHALACGWDSLVLAKTVPYAFMSHKNYKCKPSMMEHARNPSTWEAEAVRSRIQDQPVLCSKTLTQKKKKRKNYRCS